MRKKYKISEIQKALDLIEVYDPKRESISMNELEKLIIDYNKPWIYNIDEIIRLLEEFLNLPVLPFPIILDSATESDVCKILKVKKLTMHEWRKKKFVENINSKNRTVKYDLDKLLRDLKNVHDKNISARVKFGKSR